MVEVLNLKAEKLWNLGIFGCASGLSILQLQVKTMTL